MWCVGGMGGDGGAREATVSLKRSNVLSIDGIFGVALSGHDVSTSDDKGLVAMDTSAVQVRTNPSCYMVSLS